ncbi:hypothetical protein FRC10_009730 [Ceratobasidium sp. 414]|nr:hypothetical protein FRC10_009730 [Ceratobasidium sp. 414]
MGCSQSDKGKGVNRSRRGNDEDEHQHWRKNDHGWGNDLDDEDIHAIQAVLKISAAEKKKEIECAKQCDDDGPVFDDGEDDDEPSDKDTTDDDDDPKVACHS